MILTDLVRIFADYVIYLKQLFNLYEIINREIPVPLLLAPEVYILASQEQVYGIDGF